MKLKRATILELKPILVEEFGLKLEGKELETFAYSLVGYFDLLAKINFRHEVRKSSRPPSCKPLKERQQLEKMEMKDED